MIIGFIQTNAITFARSQMLSNYTRATLQIALFVIFLQACAHGGPYKGRVIEETSGQPIAGAVVVVYWSYMTANVGGGTTHCLDADEAVTDEGGEFDIAERRAGLFGRTGTANLAIYKVGYQRLGPGPWSSLKEASTLKEIVKWEGDRAIIPLKRVAKSRLGYEGRPPSGGCGRRDGKPLTAYSEEEIRWERAMGLTK